MLKLNMLKFKILYVIGEYAYKCWEEKKNLDLVENE